MILSEDQLDNDTGSIDYPRVQTENELTISSVEAYILRTMAEKPPYLSRFDQHVKPKKKEIIVMAVIVVISILFLYIQKAIYFSK